MQIFSSSIHRDTVTHSRAGGPVPVKALFQWGSEAVQQISSYCDLKPAPATPSRSTETLVLVGSVMVGCRLTSFRLNWSTLQLRAAFLFFDPSPDSAAHLFLQCSENTRWNSAQDWATRLKLHPSPSATTKPTRFVNWMTYFLLFLLVKFVGGFW